MKKKQTLLAVEGLRRVQALLAEYEIAKKRSDSPQGHEKKWARYEEFNKAMNEVRETMMLYARLLALASEVPESLLID